jgi:integrase
MSEADQSSSRSRPAPAGRSVDLDETTIYELRRWRIRLQREGLPQGEHDWIFRNPAGRPINPDSLSQLFDRIVRARELPRISIHGLRHTHASLLVAARTPIKVVSERLGHAHPGFTMATHQHLIPGMSAAAAQQFRRLGGRGRPVDVYRPERRESAGHRVDRPTAGRRRR